MAIAYLCSALLVSIHFMIYSTNAKWKDFLDTFWGREKVTFKNKEFIFANFKSESFVSFQRVIISQIFLIRYFYKTFVKISDISLIVLY